MSTGMTRIEAALCGGKATRTPKILIRSHIFGIPSEMRGRNDKGFGQKRCFSPGQAPMARHFS